MTKSDFTANLSEEETQEVDAAVKHEKITRENEVTKTLKDKDDLDHEIAYLEDEIGTKTNEEKRLEQEIYEAQIEMKKVTMNRKEENKDFEVIIAVHEMSQQHSFGMMAQSLNDAIAPAEAEAV